MKLPLSSFKSRYVPELRDVWQGSKYRFEYY